jgi:hypothetical protein
MLNPNHIQCIHFWKGISTKIAAQENGNVFLREPLHPVAYSLITISQIKGQNMMYRLRITHLNKFRVLLLMATITNENTVSHVSPLDNFHITFAS